MTMTRHTPPDRIIIGSDINVPPLGVGIDIIPPILCVTILLDDLRPALVLVIASLGKIVLRRIGPRIITFAGIKSVAQVLRPILSIGAEINRNNVIVVVEVTIAWTSPWSTGTQRALPPLPRDVRRIVLLCLTLSGVRIGKRKIGKLHELISNRLALFGRKTTRFLLFTSNEFNIFNDNPLHRRRTPPTLLILLLSTSRVR